MNFSLRGARWAAVLTVGALLGGAAPATSAEAEGLPPGRTLYFGEGTPQDLIAWRPLRREDFTATKPPGNLASHAGLIGAVSCVGLSMHETGASVVRVEHLPTGEKRYVARLYEPRFTAVFDRMCSWWNPNSDDPAYLLEHEQVHFDITEAAARRLTWKIRTDPTFKTRSPSREDALARLDVWVGIEVKQVLQETQALHEHFDRETSAVRSRENQARWARETRAEIEALASRPRWRNRP